MFRLKKYILTGKIVFRHNFTKMIYFKNIFGIDNLRITGLKSGQKFVVEQKQWTFFLIIFRCQNLGIVVGKSLYLRSLNNVEFATEKYSVSIVVIRRS